MRKRPWCWESLRAEGEGGDRGWDGWMASPTQWTWVWASSGRWWRTGKPGVLQSIGSQRVDWYIKKVPTNIHNTYMCVFSLPIHQSLNLCLHSTFWWLWIMLLYTWVYRILFETLLSVLLSKYSGVVLLYQVVILYLTSWRTTTVFHSSCTIFHSHQMYISLPASPHLCLYL